MLTEPSLHHIVKRSIYAQDSWTDHVNAPLIRSASSVKMSGPPQSFAEGKAHAEQLLRSHQVIAGIDELSSPSGGLSAQMGLTVQQKEALSAAHVDTQSNDRVGDC